jgi:hypothetical protein
MKILEIDFDRLVYAFSGIKDPRGARGRRHPLSAILALCTLGLLCGKKTYKDISRWGREHKNILKRIGFVHQLSPVPSTFTKLFKKLNPRWYEEALERYLGSEIPDSTIPNAVAAIDGKTLRGTRYFMTDHFARAHKIVTMYIPDTDKIIGFEVAKYEDEISAAGAILEEVSITGKCVTGDAAFTHPWITSKVLKQSADFLLVVKGNQEGLLNDIKQSLF